MRRVLAAAVVAVGLVGCGGDDGTTDASTTTAGDTRVYRVCFHGDSLQTLGGELLASPSGAQAEDIFADAFAPSLRSALNQIEGPDAQQIVKEAEQGLAQVKANPELLLNEQKLDETFASTQAAAEDAGRSWC